MVVHEVIVMQLGTVNHIYDLVRTLLLSMIWTLYDNVTVPLYYNIKSF